MTGVYASVKKKTLKKLEALLRGGTGASILDLFVKQETPCPKSQYRNKKKRKS